MEKTSEGFIKRCRRCGDWIIHHTTAKIFCDNCVRVNNRCLKYSWRKIRLKILERDKYICQECGLEAKAVDHIVPVSLDGNDNEDNLRAICKSCNSKKGSKFLIGC